MVAIETVGPPFVRRPDAGLDLAWGLAAAPLRYDPPAADPSGLSLVTTEPAELAPVALTLQREPARSLPNLARFPIAVVTAEASMFAMFDRHLVAFLRQAGCDAELVRLADHGVHGNGHGMMLERNHEQALAVITRWVAASLRLTPTRGALERHERREGRMATTQVRTGKGIAVTVALAAATVGVVYGYDTGSIAGALLFIPAHFHLSTSATEWITTFTGIGLIVGALLAKRIADRFGRKPAMVMISVGFTVFAILQATAQDIVWLDVSRFLLGVSIGVSTVAAPVFIAESAPAAIRGALIVGYQVATVAGIMVAYFADYIFARAAAHGGSCWACRRSASALVLIVLLRLPDTPRWYLMQGRRQDALRTLRMVDPTADAEHAAREIEIELGAERRGEPARDGAAALPASDRVRARPRLPGPDHRHQRDHLLQPVHLRRRRLVASLRAVHPGPDGDCAARCSRPSRRCWWWIEMGPPVDAVDRRRGDDRVERH